MAEESWAGISYADLADPQKDFLTSVIQDSDRNFFLKGCAGSGKTVIAAHAVRLLRKKKYICKIISLYKTPFKIYK